MEKLIEISLSESKEKAIIEDLIRQFKPIDSNEYLDQNSFLDEDFVGEALGDTRHNLFVVEDISKISYNDYYIKKGVDYIKKDVKLNDPLMNLIFEKEAENIKTPLDEWNNKEFINNNLDLNI